MKRKLIRVDFVDRVFQGQSKIDHVVLSNKTTDYRIEIDDNKQLVKVFYKSERHNTCADVPFSNVAGMTYTLEEDAPKKAEPPKETQSESKEETASETVETSTSNKSRGRSKAK